MAEQKAGLRQGGGELPPASDSVHVAVDEALQKATEVLRNTGAPSDHAQLQAEVLIDAELSGVPSHGLLRLERIVERAGNGVLDVAARGHHQWAGQAFLRVDGQRGFGPVILDRALEQAMPRAKDIGVVAIGVSNSNHIGKLGWYAERVARRGLILILFSTSEALVHPWGGRKALLGTNPIAIGVPTANGPFIIDLATSLVSMGKIHDYANRDMLLPPGWALDAKGAATIDAHAAKKGAIAPFGQGKGYALGLAFELLVAALTDSALGTEVKGTLDSTQICNKGDMALIVNPQGEGIGARLAQYLDEIRNSPPAEGFDRVLIPGDRAERQREYIMRNGISLPREIWRRLGKLRGTRQTGDC